MDVNSLAHTKWDCKYHIVFAPKYRRQVIYKDIKADVGQRVVCTSTKVMMLIPASLPISVSLRIR